MPPPKPAVGAHIEPGPTAGIFTVSRFGPAGPALVAARGLADPRGVSTETYSERDFAALGISDRFVQADLSSSVAAGTVRGPRFQVPPGARATRVRVLGGSVPDVAVDLRRGAGSYGRHLAIGPDAEAGQALYIPTDLAHGLCTLEPDTAAAYRVSTPCAPDLERCVACDDPDLAMPWPSGPERGC